MLVILLVSLIVLIFLGMDLSFAMMASSVLIVGAVFLQGDQFIPLEVIPQHLFAGVDSFSFTAIPLFILMGEIMNRGGITDYLVTFCQRMVGHIRGGVAQTGVALNVVMAGISGSAVADCAATGSILIPAMTKDGYSPAKSSAIISAASTIAPVFPPSIPMIIIGSITGISVGKLFLAGVIPGLMMAISLMVYLYFYAKRHNMPRREKATVKERLFATRDALPTLMLPILVVVTIFSGVVSPTESAVIGVLYALVLTIVFYRKLTFHGLYTVFLEAVVSTGSIMLICAAGVLFGWIATFFGLGDLLQEFLFSLGENKLTILILVNLLLLVLGIFFEAIPIILLMVPILYPVLMNVGIDPIHFSVIMVVNLMIGLITPPIGLHLYITAAIAKIPITHVIKASVPFMVVLLTVLVLVTFIPALSLYLPNLLLS